VIAVVTYTQLKNAVPSRWATAADDWLKLAQESERAAGHIYERGQKALADNWTDALGQRAGARCGTIATGFEVAGVSMRGVVTTLDGLADALELAKGNLDSAVNFATRARLKIDGNGHVTVPPGVTDPHAAEQAKQAGALIADAVADATTIDNEAAAMLNKLAQAVTSNDPAAVENGVQEEASHNQLEMIKAAMPTNADPATQAAWWNSLTPAQQTELMKAAPVELYDMKGIPQQTKTVLAGTDGYNRVEMIRWAQNNWNNGKTDVPGMNNCANFVSYALNKGGGVDMKRATWGIFDDDAWFKSPRTGVDDVDKRAHSDSWTNADAQRDFMLKHGGHTVATNQAQPGDIIYFEKKDGGEVHHAAVVTSVTPDGDVHYTQHNTDNRNISLNGRLHYSGVAGGDDTPVVVRPNPNWD
jgi:cell wall-associated NlpC family hydrolase